VSEYRFVIDGAYTPATLPMERLAEYMRALADLLGEKTQVHFKSVDKGSAVLVADVEDPAEPKVWHRVTGVRSGSAPAEVMKAFHVLDEFLREDNARGRLLESSNDNEMLSFPGRDRPEPIAYGPFKQDGTLDGEVIRVGGKDETIPVNLRDGPVIHTKLSTTREIARRLAKHLFEGVVRVHGTGVWYRGGDGTWELLSFKIVDFELLDDAPLGDVVERLRKTPGNEWGEVPDPVRELLERRHGDGEPH
jgi:hypothetical protein